MINQIELISAICINLDEQGHSSLSSRQINAIIRAADSIIEECNREPVMASAGMGLRAWLLSDDVGESSRYMAGVLSGEFRAEYAHPYDLADFGRCSRLLKAAPELRPKLGQMAQHGEHWASLVEDWQEIETLIEEGNHEYANALVMKPFR